MVFMHLGHNPRLHERVPVDTLQAHRETLLFRLALKRLFLSNQRPSIRIPNLAAPSQPSDMAVRVVLIYCVSPISVNDPLAPSRSYMLDFLNLYSYKEISYIGNDR
jgi:hypothetical protein